MREFRWDIFIEFYFKIIPYISVTLEYVIGSILFGTVIGAFVAAGRLSKKKLFRGIAAGYITIMRCVPSIVLLFLVYYGLPMVLEQKFNIIMGDADTIVYVILTFSLLLGSSIAEILRTAYLSVPQGQFEAAVMVGLSPVQAFFRIILPQAFRVALPNYGNIFIFMLKEGALAYTIGFQDVLGRGLYLNGLKTNVFSLETYVALTLVYWPCTLLLEFIFGKLEKKLRVDEESKEKHIRKKKRKVVEEYV